MKLIEPLNDILESSLSFAVKIQQEIFSFHEFSKDDFHFLVNYQPHLLFIVTYSANANESIVTFQYKDFPSLFLKSFVYSRDNRWMEYIHKNHDRAGCQLTDIEMTDLIRNVFLYLYSMGIVEEKPKFMESKLFFSLPYKALASYSEDSSLIDNLSRLDELSTNIPYSEHRNIRFCSYILYMIKGRNNVKYEVLSYLLFDQNYRILNDQCRLLITEQDSGEILCFLSLNVVNDKCVDTLLVKSLFDNIPYRVLDLSMMSLFYLVKDCGMEDIVLIEEPKISNYNSFVYTRVMSKHDEYGYILSFIEEDESNYYFFKLSEGDQRDDTRFDVLLQDIDQLEKHSFMKYDHGRGEISLSQFHDDWMDGYQKFIVDYLLGRLHLERNINRSFKLIDLEVKESNAQSSFV
ncbi:hypothetical protein K5X82_09615 [Halosquirtibacter xylanolyticus]|uniref:hypothetical protein n=1 Tax=Halosquirtibacter xylanolyticus TaxID=3374599 RepID=UPI00374892D6|nr:hypothetical protein K5X82_09615 [Prolixibacteraceae bacterium]